MDFSDYIIYADESGDHSLAKVFDEEYPVFVLAFCIFKKIDYTEQALTKLSRIKFDFWGMMQSFCIVIKFGNRKKNLLYSVIFQQWKICRAYRAEWWRDFVPRLDRVGSQREKDRIINLSSDPDAPGFDHEFISPTYRERLQQHIINYITNGGKLL